MTLGAAAQLTEILLAQHKDVDAERLARELLAARQKAAPNGWPRLAAGSQLGAALAGQHKFAEAEPLLLTSYDAMVQRKNTPAFDSDDVKLAGERIVQMYTDWRKPAQALEWKKTLAVP